MKRKTGNKAGVAATLFISILFFCMLPLSGFGASCVPVSARICVGADDEANVWINGNVVDDGTSFHGAATPPCADIPIAYLNLSGNNTVAVKNNNTISGYVWASWVIDFTCSNGSHTYVTGSDGNVTYFNQSTTASATPEPDGATLWYRPGYGNMTGWGTPTYVTNPAAIWFNPVADPINGGYLQPLSYKGMGGDIPGTPDQAPAGQVLYFRQTFSFLAPVTITKTINKTVFSLNETVTYCFNYSNPEPEARVFDLWDTIPAVTDFIGCTGGCTTTTYGSNVVVSWP
ncbi:MAG: hypothetical protein LLG37_04050, partial [Spirochaetia bacterium]|nr:hypothetical protein [Spirochaetia bacterium]